MYPAYIHTQATARNIDHAAIETYQIPSLIFMEHSKVNAEPVLELSRNKEKDTGQTGSGMLRFQHRKILYRQTGDRISGKKKGQRSGVKTNPS